MLSTSHKHMLKTPLRLQLASLTALALLVCAVPSAQAAQDCVYNGHGTPGALHRGVNLSGWWEAHPHNIFTAKDFHTIADMGFDFVRIPIDPQWLAIQDPDAQARTLQTLHCTLVSIVNNGLRVVLDLHPGDKAQQAIAAMSPDQLQTYLFGLWKNARPTLRGIPTDQVALQLLNEPDTSLHPYWWNVQGKLVTALRKLYPYRLLIVSSIQNGPWNYPDMRPYADANLLYDFHFYQPMFLTHHAAQWLQPYDPSEETDHITYPVAVTSSPADATPRMQAYIAHRWNKHALTADMQSALEWAEHAHVRLICLEFGAYRPYISQQSRANWLHDMRQILESHHIAWAVWEYNEGFGIVQPGQGVPQSIRAALGLKPAPRHNIP